MESTTHTHTVVDGGTAAGSVVVLGLEVSSRTNFESLALALS